MKQGKPAEPAEPVVAAVLSDAELVERTRRKLRAVFSEVSQLSTAQVDVTEPLESYGIDPLSVELILAMLVDAHDLDIG